ncbi:MAG: DUF1156 domain-containing protein [Candidatus Neomarinimicrobiota bacterium]
MSRPRLLIEEWLPARAIGIECMRERGSSSALAPHTYLHVWWARRPLVASRAAVLGSLLPADFDHARFERLLGFGKPSEDLIQIRDLMDMGKRVKGGFGCGRAFSNQISPDSIQLALDVMNDLWDELPIVMDPMAGGGSIPLEAARLGIGAIAGELNPVACSVLEATVVYPFQFDSDLVIKVRDWGKEWEKRVSKRMLGIYAHEEKGTLVHAFIFARTVPCPDTGHPTPLVPDWHLLKPKNKLQKHVVAMPVNIDKQTGHWEIEIRPAHDGIPDPTYYGGKGHSLFDKDASISSQYIKSHAQLGHLRSWLYAVAVKTPKGLTFRNPTKDDLNALKAAEEELNRVRPEWERENVIPTEEYPAITTDPRPRVYGMPKWADLFSPRQLLAAGVLVQELRKLKPEIVSNEGQKQADVIEHLLAFALDKLLNYNCILASWHAPRQVIRSVFDRHDYSFKATYTEMAITIEGVGLAWAIDQMLDSYEKLATLPRFKRDSQNPLVYSGSATNLSSFEGKSITAVVIDPPYQGNVQYAELADFFYVWLKRTQGHRRPEWFSTYLCDYAEEAVTNTSRFRRNGKSASEGYKEAQQFYQQKMTDIFLEARRVLRDDGVLTVMFTHKAQEAWEALFESIVSAGFTITATWPIKTESEHSLHQAKKNAAQSTVILVARKREPGAGRAWFDEDFKQEIRERVRSAANRLEKQGLNPVDQLVGTFGPAMEVYSRYDEVRDPEEGPIGVDRAIDLAAEAVSDWRLKKLAERGLTGVDPPSQFCLLCWDVLQAGEFRFNEAKLLGNAVGMDVDRLYDLGLTKKKSDNVIMLSAQERRRSNPVTYEEQLSLIGEARRRGRGSGRKIHADDEMFEYAIDMAHALVLRFQESGGETGGGIGSCKSMALHMGWGKDSAVARLIEALVKAAPPAVRFPGKKGKQTAAEKFPEFRAWHSILKPVFDLEPPEWKEPKEVEQIRLEV